MNSQEIVDNIATEIDVSVSQEEIRILAERLWISDGKPECDGTFYWLKAENSLLTFKKQQVARAILRKVIRPFAQNATASLQDEASTLCKEATELVHKEMFDNSNVILPDGVRFYKKVGQCTYVVFEQKPMTHTVLVDKQHHKGKYGASHNRNDYDVNAEHDTFHVAVPYVIYYLEIADKKTCSMRIFFRNKPFKSIHDELFKCILPNTYDNATVCVQFGHLLFKDNIIDTITNIIGTYWQSEFRYCLHWDIPETSEFNTWESWEEATKINPLFVLNMGWKKQGRTIFDYLSERGKISTQDFLYPSKELQDLSSRFVKKAVQTLSLESLTSELVDPTKQVLTPEEIGAKVKFDLDNCLKELKEKNTRREDHLDNQTAGRRSFGELV